MASTPTQHLRTLAALPTHLVKLELWGWRVYMAAASLRGLPVSAGGCKISVKSDNRRPPAARLGRGVVKRAYEGEPGQQRAEALALDARPFPVDQPHHGQASRAALREILLDHTAHLVRSKRVQFEDVLQRQPDRL